MTFVPLPFPESMALLSNNTVGESSLLALKVKMSENLVFYSETKSIIEIAIKTAVDIGNSKEEDVTTEPNMRRKVSTRLILP